MENTWKDIQPSSSCLGLNVCIHYRTQQEGNNISTMTHCARAHSTRLLCPKVRTTLTLEPHNTVLATGGGGGGGGRKEGGGATERVVL
jgi:hypothetical protein